MQLNYAKGNGLIPAVVQHYLTGQVLMLGFMNEEAVQKTISEKKVTFFSRSKNRLWTKGETSGNVLLVKEIIPDCDEDTLLIRAEPTGPVCHTGAPSCFDDKTAKGFLYELENLIHSRQDQLPDGSYTAKLFAEGINRIACKVGEEAIELIIEAKDSNRTLFLNEAADLLYHFLVLLAAKQCALADVEEVLKARSQPHPEADK
ncbi:MAG: histidine biosynthesis bifunctional protein HisIE [Chitinophagales bacterium]|nr:MAG: histidine biosynthesis bifunctional protein HisIE [Chitinophagales bacterium]